MQVLGADAVVSVGEGPNHDAALKARVHLPHFLGVAVVHAIGLGFAVQTFSLSALATLLIMLYLTACVGWSVGLHRCIIHRSFSCPRPVRYVLAYFGTLAGIGGPISTYEAHNGRDYYQSMVDGPDVSGYRTGLVRSYYSLLLDRTYPAEAVPVPPDVTGDAYYRFLDRTNILQQIPVALVLYAIGGWSFVVWGVFLRIAVLFDLFAAVNYFGHTAGYQTFRIHGVTDEGRNNPIMGVIGMGEGWHNNHHAYPSSAKIGHRWWELDLGYLTIVGLRGLRLVRDVKTPSNTPLRPQAERI